MEEKRNNETFVSDERTGKGVGNNTVAEAIMQHILAKAGEGEQESTPKPTFVLFAEADTDFDFDEYRNSLDAEQERIEQKMQLLEKKRGLIDGWRKSIEYYRDALFGAYQEIDRRGKKIEELQQVIEDKKNEYEILSGTANNLLNIANEARAQKKELEMQLTEMRKMSEGMAKKASEDAVLGFLRTWVNHSRRKTSDKRVFAKQAALEIANANGLTLPPDLAAAIESLDDEQSEPKSVTVNGGVYNDVHDNKDVKVI